LGCECTFPFSMTHNSFSLRFALASLFFFLTLSFSIIIFHNPTILRFSGWWKVLCLHRSVRNWFITHLPAFCRNKRGVGGN
jgi:hypothetical protein